jgi:hypothetical protein
MPAEDDELLAPGEDLESGAVVATHDLREGGLGSV